MKFIGRIFCLSALMLMPLAAFAQQKKESIEIDYNNANLTLKHLNSLRLLSAIDNAIKDLEKLFKK